MKAMRYGLLLGVVAVAMAGSARWSLQAQDQPGTGKDAARSKEAAPLHEPAQNPGEVVLSVQDALEKPFTMPFKEPTTLAEVSHHLKRVLNAPVVLDLAALDRQELRPSDTVELELNGVRLKTALKLLLDQVGLTYRVVAEDNLLVLTDEDGASDPLDRVLAEMKEIHRDIHDVQDALDEVRAVLGLDEEGGLRMRKPTIIEDMPPAQPDEPGKPKGAQPDAGPRPRPGI